MIKVCLLIFLITQITEASKLIKTVKKTSLEIIIQMSS